MNDRRSEYPLPVGILYPLAAVLIILPLADIAIGLIPPRFHELQWRVGAIGLVSGAMLFPLLGFFLATVAAHVLEHRWAQRLLAALYAILGLLFLILVVLFALDAIQIRKDINPQHLTKYDLAAAKGVLMQVLLALMLLTLSVVSFRQSRAAHRRQQRAQRADQTSVPILGATKD